MRKFSLVLAVLLTVATSGCFRNLQTRSGTFFGSLIMEPRFTVEDRVEMYGQTARTKLIPYFAKAGLQYPPALVRFVILKEERRLEIYASDGVVAPRYVRSFPILGTSGGPGPKLREGDGQVPEGIYRVESLNPNSRFHLALRVSYPNEFDRYHGALDGRDKLGGDIMIHGNTVSTGCLAMGDSVAEQLFVLAADIGFEHIAIIASPLDFRTKSIPEAELLQQPPWVAELYQEISAELAELTRP